MLNTKISNKAGKKIIISLVSLIVLSTSCTKDYWTPVVDVKIPTEDPVLVANMYLENKVVPSVYISKNQPVLAVNPNYLVQHAVIQLFENDVERTGWQKYLNPIHNDSIWVLNNFTPTPGKVYRTIVSAPGFKNIEAIDTMPSQIPFSITKTGAYKFIEVNEPFGGQQYKDTLAEVSIKWQDDGATKDYYRIFISENDSSGYSTAIRGVGGFGGNNNRPIRSIDLIYNNGNPLGGSEGGDMIRPNEVYFSDLTFNGKQKEVLMYFPIADINNGNGNAFGKVFCFLQHTSRNAYLHATSVFTAENSDGIGIFSQPSIVYSNYKNGLGILGCNTITMDSVVVK